MALLPAGLGLRHGAIFRRQIHPVQLPVDRHGACGPLEDHGVRGLVFPVQWFEDAQASRGGVGTEDQAKCGIEAGGVRAVSDGGSGDLLESEDVRHSLRLVAHREQFLALDIDGESAGAPARWNGSAPRRQSG